MKPSGSISLAFLCIAGALFPSGEAASASLAKAVNRSYPTTCAEEDNINVPLRGRQISRYEIVATHPRYEIGQDSCSEDFSGCGQAAPRPQADFCSKMFDDGTNIVETCVVPDWWRPDTMEVIVDGRLQRGHYLRMYRKLSDADSWPQFLVLYQDGNLRLKPQPPQSLPDTCFGSSIVLGPAKSARRPFVDVLQVNIDIGTLSMDVVYQEGGSAHVDLGVDRTAARAAVQVNYWLKFPFATFRSMFVGDGNSDVDHITTPTTNLPILGDWKRLPASSWLFSRQIRSRHNTSAPDIAVTATEQPDSLDHR